MTELFFYNKKSLFKELVYTTKYEPVWVSHMAREYGIDFSDFYAYMVSYTSQYIKEGSSFDYSLRCEMNLMEIYKTIDKEKLLICLTDLDFNSFGRYQIPHYGKLDIHDAIKDFLYDNVRLTVLQLFTRNGFLQRLQDDVIEIQKQRLVDAVKEVGVEPDNMDKTNRRM